MQFLCSSQSTQVVTCIISLPFTTVRSLLLFTVYLLISSILEYTECSYRTAYMYHYKKQTYLKVELLNHTVDLFLSFWGTSIMFSTVTVRFTFSLTVFYGFLFSTSLQAFVLLVLSIVTFITNMMRYLIVVSICSSLMIGNIEFHCICTYSSPLPNF